MHHGATRAAAGNRLAEVTYRLASRELTVMSDTNGNTLTDELIEMFEFAY